MERPPIKDKAVLAYVEDLESELRKFKTSPYLKTYITISNQIDSFNEQLTIQTVKEVEIKVPGGASQFVDIIPGKIDLFADKDSKEFDRGWKYLNECVDLNKKLDELRKLMTPEDLKELQKIEDLKNLPMAERMALKSRDGKH